MKVAFCVNSFLPTIGGCEKVVDKIAKHLSQEHDVFIITRFVKNRQHHYPEYEIIEYSPHNISLFDGILTVLQPDIVFVYSDVFDFFQRLISQESTPYRLIVALCGANWLYSHTNYIKLLTRRSYKIDALVCHSDCHRDYKLFSSGPLSAKKHVIPNGVDLEEFDTNNLTRNDLYPSFSSSDISDKKWVLNISNFFPGKGQEHLLYILDSLPQKEDFVYIQISSDVQFSVGKNLEDRWLDLCRQFTKLNVRFLKNISREETIGFLKQSNVFAFTSETEVAPLVLLESMAAELPWVATDIGNTRMLKGGICLSAIKNRKFHSVFDDRMNTLFRNAICEACENSQIGIEGRRQIEDELSWDNILPKYSDLINKKHA